MVRRLLRRFIPTYMGNAILSLKTARPCTVHPHVHGERSESRSRHPLLAGSSPRTWGTRGPFPSYRDLCRFIPTYMGNAVSDNPCSVEIAVHPHVHGERMTARVLLPMKSGSSPRTWGTPGDAVFVVLVSRFIPTYMGNARLRGTIFSYRPVHPHVHGERG